jgi:hypothetical protein
VRSVVDNAALAHVSSEYSSFPCHSFHQLLHTHHNPSDGVGTVGQIEASVAVGSVPMNNEIGVRENGRTLPLYIFKDARTK